MIMALPSRAAVQPKRSLGNEALDRLSVYFCLAPLEEAMIDQVPVDNEGGETDWDLRPERGNAVALSPYPFRRNSLEFSIMARRIPKRVYDDDLDFQKTLAHSPYFAKKFTLHDAGERAQSRAGAA